jgi:hypothetical protein
MLLILNPAKLQSYHSTNISFSEDALIKWPSERLAVLCGVAVQKQNAFHTQSHLLTEPY